MIAHTALGRSATAICMTLSSFQKTVSHESSPKPYETYQAVSSCSMLKHMEEG